MVTAAPFPPDDHCDTARMSGVHNTQTKSSIAKSNKTKIQVTHVA